MDVVLQDDSAIVERAELRPAVLERWKALGGTNVRINVLHGLEPPQPTLAASMGRISLEAYDAAVRDVRAAGLVPQITLTWYRETDPAAIAAWMGDVVAHFGPRVSLYSVLNEPDLMIPAADDCDPEEVQRLVRVDDLRVYDKRVAYRRYLSKTLIIRRGGRRVRRQVPLMVRKRVAIGKVRGKPRYRVLSYRKSEIRHRIEWVSALTSRGVQEAGVSLKQGCLKVTRARKYRAIFLAAAPAIRRSNPRAVVLAGETSPVTGIDLFIHHVLQGGLPSADGWAHHPYQYLAPEGTQQPYGTGDCQTVRAAVGMPLYFTEWGVPQTGSAHDMRAGGRFTQESNARDVLTGWTAARDCDVKQMAQYMFFPAPGERWDTSLNQGADQPPSLPERTLQGFLATGG